MDEGIEEGIDEGIDEGRVDGDGKESNNPSPLNTLTVFPLKLCSCGRH